MKKQFLEQVIVTAKLKRLTHYERSADRANPYYLRKWVPLLLEKPTVCTFLGYRTVCNGIVSSPPYDPEAGSFDRYLDSPQYVKVALVILDERTNPFYVDLEDMQ